MPTNLREVPPGMVRAIVVVSVLSLFISIVLLIQRIRLDPSIFGIVFMAWFIPALAMGASLGKREQVALVIMGWVATGVGILLVGTFWSIWLLPSLPALSLALSIILTNELRRRAQKLSPESAALRQQASQVKSASKVANQTQMRATEIRGPSEYQDYLGTIITKLARGGFEIRKDLAFGEYRADLFASKLHVGLINAQFVVLVSFVETMNLEQLQRLVDKAYIFSLNLRQTWAYTILALPAVVSRSFPQEVKAFVTDYDGKKSARGRWDIEHPVLVELDTKTLTHFAKGIFTGGEANDQAIKAANKYLSFD